MNALIAPMCDALAALARESSDRRALQTLRPLLAAYLQLHAEDRDLAFALRRLEALIAEDSDAEPLRNYMAVVVAELLVTTHAEQSDWAH